MEPNHWWPSPSAELSELLAKKFAKWQLPDDYKFLDSIPRTSTGKFWKLKLREMFAGRTG